uniref:Glucose dehydrogenase n=1 Tax=Ampulex compressa TaxID=860918 RepID=A0A1W6EW29_AMPCP|nr:glucose dehydrogenase [Ampulex compressa]
MAYHRGNPTNYRKWQEMGNTGWSWEDVFPYFLKGENNKEIGRVSGEYHAVGGPMTVERFPWQPPFASAILNAAVESGYGVSEDLVGKKITGFTVAQTLSVNGVRQSTAAAYLRPIRDRPNLDIALSAQVTTVILAGKKATGVRYILNGKKHDVFAKKEVILSAGAINSPQILLLSGIGPKEHLKEMKIRPVLDLPGVGRNLHNHISYGVDFLLNQKPTQEFNLDSADLYLYNQTGPMSSTGLAQVTGILASNYTNSNDPDIQIFFAGFQAICPTGGRIADLKVEDNKETVRFTGVNVQARSRGVLTLASKDPLVQPVIRSNELSDPQDVSVVVQALRAIIKLANTKVMKKYGLKMIRPNIPQCSNYAANSDDYWSCAIHWDTRPENHQAGTCKMGPSTDPLAVVDPRLKVYGVKGLRVADASIMPQVVAGNPVAAINMIGERAADFIKQDWGATTL